jgi:hypothetical protein
VNALDNLSDTAKVVVGCVFIALAGVVGAALLAEFFGVLTQ